MQGQSVRVRIVAAYEVYLRFHETAEEMDVPGKPIQFGDDEDSLGSFGVHDGFGQFRAVRGFAGFYLLVTRDDLVVPGECVTLHASNLCFKSESGFALFPCADPIVGYEITHEIFLFL